MDSAALDIDTPEDLLRLNPDKRRTARFVVDLASNWLKSA
jgi:hypothetical protein